MRPLQCDKSTDKNSFHLFEVVKSRKNDVMSSSDKTHGGQQLQHKGFGPAAALEGSVLDTHGPITHTLSHTLMHSPGIPAVEAERDLVHTARMNHHQVKTRLKEEEKHKQPVC